MSLVFSIITPSFEAAEKLPNTIRSVLLQTGVALEYLIVDGGSKDGTSAIVNSFATDGRVRFYSEPDDGIYDAMNKGIARAQGRFIYFLGAGDLLCPGVLAQVAERLPEPGSTLVYGDVIWVSKKIKYDGRFTRRKMLTKNICHQAIFYERSIFSLLGKYETKYRYWSDWAFNMKCMGNRSIRKQYIDLTIAEYEGDGCSNEETDHAFRRDYECLVKERLGLPYFLQIRAERAGRSWLSKVRM